MGLGRMCKGGSYTIYAFLPGAIFFLFISKKLRSDEDLELYFVRCRVGQVFFLPAFPN